MTAEQMFKDLGFWSRKRTDTEIVWTRKVRDDFIEKEIIFNLEVAKVAIEGGWLTKDELIAVSKQCEELGWLESEQEQENNLDHYKHEILEACVWDLAVVKGKPKQCNKTNCSDCDFKSSLKGCHKKVMDWLKQPYERPTYKLTQCEYDMLDTIFEKDARFSTVYLIGELKKKGYFENIECNSNVRVKGILANCEVVQ